MSRLPSAPPSTSPPPSSPLPRASLPRDCPILRPRAGLLLSRACDSPFAMSFGATYAHASPLILAARCVVAAACLRRDMSSALQACSRLCAHISMLPNLACSLILSILLSCSQDDRDAHQLCSGEDGCAQQRDHVVGVFPRRDEDCVGIGRQDDQSLGSWCAASSNHAPHWPKLTPVGLPSRRAGAAEREDERPQQAHQLGGVFPRWHEDRVRMQWRDDQSLGYGQVVSQTQGIP